MRSVNCVVPLFILVATMAGVQNLEGKTCEVPNETYPTIQKAVDDLDCSEVVLGAQVYSESLEIRRTVVIQGVSIGETTISGQVRIYGGEVEMDNLIVDASSLVGLAGGSAVAVRGGGELRGTNLVVRDNAGFLADGFESDEK